jgi:hypothetical protein
VRAEGLGQGRPYLPRGRGTSYDRAGVVAGGPHCAADTACRAGTGEAARELMAASVEMRDGPSAWPGLGVMMGQPGISEAA